MVCFGVAPAYVYSMKSTALLSAAFGRLRVAGLRPTRRGIAGLFDRAALVPVFLKDRELMHPSRVIAFTILTPFYFLKAGSLILPTCW